MILRSTTIQECWCPKCSAGQMEKIHDIIFHEGIPPTRLIGRKIICDKCGFENKIEDVISVVPTSFLVSSINERSKHKTNDELMKWLNME